MVDPKKLSVVGRGRLKKQVLRQEHSYLERPSTTLRPKWKKLEKSVQYLIGCRFSGFSSQTVKEDFYCPVCKDVLCQPVETVCEHYFCGGCLKDVMLNSGIPFNCPVCKTQLNAAEQIKRPSRMVPTLIAELKVKCTDCGGEFSYSSHLGGSYGGPLPREDNSRGGKDGDFVCEVQAQDFS